MDNILPHQQRVMEEKADLDEKSPKLFSFFQTSIFESLPDAEKQRLRRQWTAMRHYAEILGERIGAFPFNQGA